MPKLWALFKCLVGWKPKEFIVLIRSIKVRVVKLEPMARPATAACHANAVRSVALWGDGEGVGIELGKSVFANCVANSNETNLGV